MTNKKTDSQESVFCVYYLLRLWCIYRTNVSASAAIDASSFVNNIYAVTCSNSVNGTFWFAGAAADAILIDYICHLGFLL